MWNPESSHDLVAELRALLGDECDLIANLANTAALLFARLPDLNWAGFYLLRGGQLVLGPFQGKPACVRIDVGRGVCGTAAARRETIVVPDVHQFPGHIACDAASQSEIVVPLLRGEELLGVLDLDSPLTNRFTAHDARQLEAIVEVLLAAPELPPSPTEIALAFQRLIAVGQIREAFERYVAADFRHHNAYYRGDRESLRQGMEENYGRFPEKRLEVKQTLADGDRVAVHSRVSLTPNGPHLALVHMFRVVAGKIVEMWDVGQPIPDDVPNENGLF